MWTISRLFLICVGLTWVYSKEESISDLYSLLSDPDVLKLVEKRLKILDDEELVPDVGCYDLKGALIGNCGFETNKSTIIKTTQSIARGAKFIEEVSNVSCPRECTSLCCEKPDCDTAIYQDKEGHNCYLFQCGTGDVCEFAPHDSYWTSSISIIEKEVVLPGGSHENDLANVGTIGAPDVKPSVKPQTEPTTTVAPEVPTTPKPGLGEKCESYETQCEDQHAECLMRSCRCRVGYHEKNGICRKHCQDEEFECENIVYGSDSRQCVLNRYVCDGHPDCIDGSDELNCQDKTKYGFLDTDNTGAGSLYNPFYNPLYNSKVGQQLPLTNQLYPNQLGANQNLGGNYFLPGSANQNAVGGNMLPTANQQWSQPVLGSQGYQNNPLYQQQGYFPTNQGYGPALQQPINLPNSGLNMNTGIQQPVQTKMNPNTATDMGANQQNSRPNVQIPNQNGLPVEQPRQKSTQTPAFNKPETIRPYPSVKSELSKDMDRLGQLDYDTITTSEPDIIETHNIPMESDHRGNNPESSDLYDDLPLYNKEQKTYNTDKNYIPSEGSHDLNKPQVDANRAQTSRPLTEPATTKARTQVQTPTQSTVAGQKHHNSEGFPDYSWINYSNNDKNAQNQRISGKKGTEFHASSGRKPGPDTNSAGTDSQPLRERPEARPKPDSNTRPVYTHDNAPKVPSNRRPVDYNDDDYPYDNDYRRPGMAGNRRPSYGRYDSRYDNSRKRPPVGSRYPYYDTRYPGYKDRNPYPVWDPYKDEYYYPENYDDQTGGNLDLRNNMKSGGRPGNDRIPADGTNSPETHGRKPGSHGDRPAQPPPSTQKAAPTTTVAVKAQPTVAPSPTPAPVKPDDSAENHPDTDSPPLDTDQTPSNPDQHTEQASSDTDPSSSSSSSDTSDLSKSTDEDSPSVSSSEEKSASNTNTNVNKADSDSESDSDNKSNDIGDQNDEHTESDNPQSNKPELHILNAIDGESVESLIDSSQGPIIALALGLTVTILMLIIVGCRLRTVKRRLRKGRALHSNEADYLINGMYL